MFRVDLECIHLYMYHKLYTKDIAQRDITAYDASLAPDAGMVEEMKYRSHSKA